MLFKIEVSTTGKDCKVEVCTESNSGMVQGFLDTIIDLIAIKWEERWDKEVSEK